MQRKSHVAKGYGLGKEEVGCQQTPPAVALLHQGVLEGLREVGEKSTPGTQTGRTPRMMRDTIPVISCICGFNECTIVFVSMSEVRRTSMYGNHYGRGVSTRPVCCKYYSVL